MTLFFRNFFLGVSLAAPLGPAGVAVIQNGLRDGFRAAFLTGIGVTLADTAYMSLVFLGLAPFLDLAGVRIGVWSLGSLALVYFGIRSLQRAIGHSRADTGEVQPMVARHPLLMGFVVNASNPLAIVWWLGVFGGLLLGTDPNLSTLHALITSGAILLGILCWHASMALLTHWGGRLIGPGVGRWVSLIAGVLLIAFGLTFAVSAIQAGSALWIPR